MILESDPKAAAERAKLSQDLRRHEKEPRLEAAALPTNLDDDRPTTGGLKLLFFQPEPMWRKVKVPVLLVWGDKDTVVPVEEGRKKIEAALRRSGNRDVTVKIFPDVDHGVARVVPKGTWDFPRVALDYYDYIATWAADEVGVRVPPSSR
jgi:pimeloyl-ACP methyl ester carboxylesterase